MAVYAKGVNLYFNYGAELPDPDKLLQGSGNQGRFIRLDNLAMLDRPEVKNLLQTALTQADPPLPATGRGYIVIKSISAKQRPRRAQSKQPLNPHRSP